MQLIPIKITDRDPRYEALAEWNFSTEKFYEAQIYRLLKDDIPIRINDYACEFWVYQDNQGQIVGYSSLHISDEYLNFTAQKPYLYIPLLAVNPNHKGKGYGKFIVNHLLQEAQAQMIGSPTLAKQVLLDVYTVNEIAIGVYEKAGFIKLNADSPIADKQENQAAYIVMAKVL